MDSIVNKYVDDCNGNVVDDFIIDLPWAMNWASHIHKLYFYLDW